MIYPYYCVLCGEYSEIVKSATEASREEICPTCSIVLKRIYTAPQFTVTHRETYYDHALGCTVSSKRDIEDAQKKYYDREGSELVGIGNDSSIKSLKPQTQSYDLPREVMAQIEDN